MDLDKKAHDFAMSYMTNCVAESLRDGHDLPSVDNFMTVYDEAYSHFIEQNDISTQIRMNRERPDKKF